MVSPTQRTWVLVNSGRWWGTGKPDVVQPMGSQQVGHDSAEQLNNNKIHIHLIIFRCSVVSNYSPPKSSVPGISQARIKGWVTISYSSKSTWPRDQTHVSCVSCIGRWILYHWTTRECIIYNFKLSRNSSRHTPQGNGFHQFTPGKVLHKQTKKYVKQFNNKNSQG